MNPLGWWVPYKNAIGRYMHGSYLYKLSTEGYVVTSCYNRWSTLHKQKKRDIFYRRIGKTKKNIFFNVFAVENIVLYKSEIDYRK